MNIKDLISRYLGKLEGKIDLRHQAHVRKVCERVFAFEEMSKLSFV